MDYIWGIPWYIMMRMLLSQSNSQRKQCFFVSHEPSQESNLSIAHVKEAEDWVAEAKEVDLGLLWGSTVQYKKGLNKCKRVDARFIQA